MPQGKNVSMQNSFQLDVYVVMLASHNCILASNYKCTANIINNHWCACAARVTVVGLCVFALICCLTHWNHKKGIPTDSSQYGNHLKCC